MKRYDPEVAPTPHEWLALSEAERIAQAEAHHVEAGISLPNVHGHAAFHAIVENQLALEDQPVVRSTLQRLIGEGLSRHDAIHAISSVLAAQIHDLAKSKRPADNQNAIYYRNLQKLTAARWRDG